VEIASSAQKRTYRQIDVEDPTPACCLHDGAAHVWTNSSSDEIYDQNNSHIVSSLSEGHKVGNNHIDDHVDATTTHTLNSPASYECRTVICATCDSASQCEERDYR